MEKVKDKESFIQNLDRYSHNDFMEGTPYNEAGELCNEYDDFVQCLTAIESAASAKGVTEDILGIITMFQAQFFAGLITMIAGILSSWIGSLALYGFGELIEKVISIDQKLSAYGQSSNVPVPPRGYTPVSSNAASHTSTSAPAKPSAAPSPVAEPRDYERDAKVLAAGGWRCQCGRVNQPYLTTCNCGRHKWDLENIQQEQQ